MDNYEDLIAFLDKLHNQGNMKFQTARTRKTAIRKVFGGSCYSNESIMTLDISDLMKDFKARSQSEIKEDTFNTYKSRIKRSIDDYIRIEKLGDKPKQEYIKEPERNENKIVTVEVQCPIRDGEFIIDIKNLPINLNKEELKKVIEMIQFVTN
jgi:hypothetical protein